VHNQGLRSATTGLYRGLTSEPVDTTPSTVRGPVKGASSPGTPHQRPPIAAGPARKRSTRATNAVVRAGGFGTDVLWVLPLRVVNDAGQHLLDCPRQFGQRRI